MQRSTSQDSKAMISDRLLMLVEAFVKNKVADNGLLRSTQICDVSAGETCKMLLGDPKTGFTDPFILINY
jgi:hypothetical protein